MRICFHLPLPKDLGTLFAYNIHLLSKYIIDSKLLLIYMFAKNMHIAYVHTHLSIHLFIHQIFIEHQMNCGSLELDGTYAVILFRSLNVEQRNLES